MSASRPVRLRRRVGSELDVRFWFNSVLSHTQTPRQTEWARFQEPSPEGPVTGLFTGPIGVPLQGRYSQKLERFTRC